MKLLFNRNKQKIIWIASIFLISTSTLLAEKLTHNDIMEITKKHNYICMPEKVIISAFDEKNYFKNDFIKPFFFIFFYL